MKLSILIPIYNERLYLPEVFRRICRAPYPDGISSVELIAVDDGSTDGSRAWLEALHDTFARQYAVLSTVPTSFRFEPQERNQGKGAAIRRGIRHSVGEIVLIQDADFEYSPEDYPKLLQPILSNEAEVVFGSRFMGSRRRVLFFWHALVNRFLTLTFNVFSNTIFTDIETCYKVMKGDLARSLRLNSQRFGIEVELAARVAQAHVRIYEVGISYQGRSYEEGKKIGWRDGVAALFHLLRYCLFDRGAYLPGMKQTLHALDDSADRFYKKHLQRDLDRLGLPTTSSVLEIGAGIGTITQLLVSRFQKVVATDIDAEMVRAVAQRYRYVEGFTTAQWDASLPLEDQRVPPPVLEGKFDLIVAFNVLEHLADPEFAMAQWRRLLAPEGVLLVLVPFSQKLYTPIDAAVGHYKRYSRGELSQLFESHGISVLSTRYVNPLGVLGWLLNGRVLKRNYLPQGQVKLYHFLKPILRPVEWLAEKVFGLSIIAVGRA